MMDDDLHRLHTAFPTLVQLLGEERLAEDLALWEHAITIERRFLVNPIPGYCRAFWNELLTCYAADASGSQSFVQGGHGGA